MSDQRGAKTGLLARIASSAEYSIAVALLAVCVVVGGALWLLQPDADELTAAPTAAPTAQVAVVDEDAALSDWKRRLGEQFSEAEEQQRQRAAEAEQARRARALAQEEAAAARRQAEAERQAQQRLEAAVAADRQTAPRPTAAAATPVPRASTPAPVPARREVALPTVPPQPALVAAAIDWSSCDPPSYPALSVRRGEEGTVVIAADLDAGARLIEARVSVSSGHAKLDRATLDAVRECRFTPALENGVPKPATAEVRFTWKLQG